MISQNILKIKMNSKGISKSDGDYDGTCPNGFHSQKLQYWFGGDFSFNLSGINQERKRFRNCTTSKKGFDSYFGFRYVSHFSPP